jgi:integrase/recombinase XerC
MINHFLTYLSVEKHYSPRTVQTYRDDLTEFCTWLGWTVDDFDPDKVSEDDVKDWIIALIDENHNAPRSVKQKLAALHSLYRFLLRTGKVQTDITRRVIAPKVDKPLPVFFKPSEMQAATAFDHDADDPESIRNCLIIQMLYQTGMRQAEMLALKDSDVDTTAHSIRVFGKRAKERIIPIGDNLCRQIEDYRAARNGNYGTFFVLWKKNGEVRPLSKGALYNIVRARMGEVSTLKKHSPHVLRHTFATTMLDNGADIRTIQQLLGHASLAATQIYTHTTFEQIKKTYNNAHPRAKNKPK